METAHKPTVAFTQLIEIEFRFQIWLPKIMKKDNRDKTIILPHSVRVQFCALT